MSLLAISAGATAVGIYFLKKYNIGGVCTSQARLDGKVAIVTGANTGIGKETARDLTKRGARVYLACRSVQRAQQAADDILASTGVPSENIRLITLDLASLESIRQCATQFKQKETRLDILVNNAGIVTNTDDQTKTVDGFDVTFGVNHLGPFLFTHLLMDLLDSSSPSRVVNVASRAHKRTVMKWETTEHRNAPSSYSGLYAYCQSKLANLLFTKELAARLKGTGVTVYAVHPGVVRTDIFQSSTPLLRHPYVYNTLSFIAWPFVKEAWAGAQTVIHCAVDEGVSKATGAYYSDCQQVQPSAAAQSADDARRLWDVSMELVGLEASQIHPRLAQCVSG